MLKSDNICHDDSVITIPPIQGRRDQPWTSWLKDDAERIVSRLKLMCDIYKHARYFTHT